MTDPVTPDDRAPRDMGCLQALEVFYAYLDGELDPATTADFEHHMAHCRSCYSRAELEALVTRRLRSAATRQAPESLKQRLRLLMEGL